MANGTPQETKPGVKTTEFWLTIFGNGIGLLNLTGAWDYVPNKWSLIFMAVINAAYKLSRGEAKKGISYVP